MSAEETLNSFNLPELTADIVSAYVSNNSVPLSELHKIISEVHAALAGLHGAQKVEEPVESLKPAVPIKKSITPDYIISLEDGGRYKSLKRHLGVKYGLTPDEYRAKWGLPSDYPMVAPNYTAQRSAYAKNSGLGRKPSVQVEAPEPALPPEPAPVPAPAPEPAPEPKKRGRKPKAE